MHVLDPAFASRCARVALDNVAREFPNKLDHLMAAEADVQRPSALHPVFFGSYDWHSAVHMHWTLVMLRARFPTLPEAGAIATLLDVHFTAERIAGECAYLARPSSASFERPYGWAWLLKLCEGLRLAAVADERAVRWSAALQPLADRFVERTLAWLPRAVHPSRAGTHGNGAFALALMLDYALAANDAVLRDALVAKAVAWFADDRAYPIAYELGSEDFLSNGLLEAVLMRRVFQLQAIGSALTADAYFARWWHAFVPDPVVLVRWLTPVQPSDRSDARLTHVDGLNLSRAWCWQQLIDAMPDALQTSVQLAIHAHRRESLPQVAQGDYVATHWLASFALLSLGV